MARGVFVGVPGEDGVGVKVGVPVTVGVNVGVDVEVFTCVLVEVEVTVEVGVFVAVNAVVFVGVKVLVKVEVAVRVMTAVFVEVMVATGVSVAVGVDVGVRVWVEVTVFNCVLVGVEVTVEVGVRVGVALGVKVRAEVLVGEGVKVRVEVWVGVSVAVSVLVKVLVAVLVAVAWAQRDGAVPRRKRAAPKSQPDRFKKRRLEGPMSCSGSFILEDPGKRPLLGQDLQDPGHLLAAQVQDHIIVARRDGQAPIVLPIPIQIMFARVHRSLVQVPHQDARRIEDCDDGLGGLFRADGDPQGAAFGGGSPRSLPGNGGLREGRKGVRRSARVARRG
jgi:hypothetical protein